MWNPWKAHEGPEWRESLEQARSLGWRRFDDNLFAARFALKRDPKGLSHAFLEDRDDLRVLLTSDPAMGYEMVVFFRLVAEYELELKWIEIREIE